MTRFTIPSFCAALFTLAAAVPAVAQTTTENRLAERVDHYGVSTFAGGSTSVRLETSMSVSPLSTRRAATAENKATVRLFGVSAEAAAVRMALSAQRDIIGFSTSGAAITRNTSLGSFQVRIGGATVISQTAVNTPLLGTVSGNAFAGITPRYDVTLFGIGYSIRGGATARADWNLTNTISFASGVSVNMTGPVRCRAVGSSSVVFNVLGAQAGVSSTLTFADTNANLSVNVLPGGAVGTIGWSVAPIRLRMEAWANVMSILNTQLLFDLNLPAVAGSTALRTL